MRLRFRMNPTVKFLHCCYPAQGDTLLFLRGLLSVRIQGVILCALPRGDTTLSDLTCFYLAGGHSVCRSDVGIALVTDRKELRPGVVEEATLLRHTIAAEEAPAQAAVMAPVEEAERVLAPRAGRRLHARVSFGRTRTQWLGGKRTDSSSIQAKRPSSVAGERAP